ncbi:MAG: chemotaxis response regulator protein-glutamate methylesterase [Candidatus Krumholzibacteriia bacterium]
MKPIRVLIIDDSPTVRALIRRGLSGAEGIEVVGVAPNPYVARDMIVKDPPDVVTLDLEMPRMDGLTFLRKLMSHYPLPVVVISTLTRAGSLKVQEALEAGAVEVVGKNLTSEGTQALMLEIVRKVRAAAGARVQSRPLGHRSPGAESSPRPLARVGCPADRLLAIGASTGGTQALTAILSRLPEDIPGTLIVQHMPPGFTAQFAANLDRICPMEVREARTGDVLQPGLALIAPGDRHLLLARKGGRLMVELRNGPRVSGHKPSVDVLFRTAADHAGGKALGVILTGMGKDGAEGLKLMHDRGAHTIAQDESSCIVYGMPREAVELGAATEIVRLDRIPEAICRALAAVPV